MSEDEQRRRRLERIFGDVLPDATRDDARDDMDDGEDGAGGRRRGEGRDDDLRRQVPPHHGNA